MKNFTNKVPLKKNQYNLVESFLLNKYIKYMNSYLYMYFLELKFFLNLFVNPLEEIVMGDQLYVVLQLSPFDCKHFFFAIFFFYFLLLFFSHI